ncbi:MAG: hypothetical protein GY940_17050, partial [bacterium]|nr:hypothetical protein [bacterium]
DWWEETLRFFMSKADDAIFDEFMERFFQSHISRQLDDNQQTFLQQLVKESPQRKIHALQDGLNSEGLNDNQKRYAMDCLNTIGTPEAVQAIEKADKSGWDKVDISYARDIVTRTAAKTQQLKIDAREFKNRLLQDSFRNPFEENAEYIKIRGGTYRYSVPKREFLFLKFKEKQSVRDFYLCKYPVTNQRY